jgi:AraC-like DNA-binding protein
MSSLQERYYVAGRSGAVKSQEPTTVPAHGQRRSPHNGVACPAAVAAKSLPGGSTGQFVAVEGAGGRLNRITNWGTVAAKAGRQPETMAVLCGVSRRQLQRHFRTHFGKTITRWCHEVRCKQAAELLVQGFRTDAAAAAVGYRTSQHFCRVFKQIYGASPQSFAAATALATMSPGDNNVASGQSSALAAGADAP